MLLYVKKYFRMYFIAVLIPTIIYLATILFMQGAGGILSPWTWIITFVLIATMAIFTSRTLDRAASTEVKRLMRAFYETCDPQLFINQGAEVAQRMYKKTPFNEWASLYMSAYGLAHIEVGDTAKASEIIDSMRESAQFSKKPAEAAHIILNMHSPVKELYGIDLALGSLAEAETKLRSAITPKRDFAEELEYVENERMVDVAEKIGDDLEVIRLYSQAYNNIHIFRRTRVMAAYKMAEANRNLGNLSQEKELLTFVVEQGNRLSVVAKAQARLDDFPEIPSEEENMIEDTSEVDKLQDGVSLTPPANPFGEKSI